MRELRWTVLRGDAEAALEHTPDGVENMARDDTLARSLGAGEGVLRFYRWRRPTLSFGRNEPATELYLGEDELVAAGLDVVRRPTGGRAVLHHRELTYAVIAPTEAFHSLRSAYHGINAALVSGLTGLGVPATQAVRAGQDNLQLPLDAGPCFRAPAEGEVVLGGRKLVGSAQVRIGRVLLQHGSILLEDDQQRLESVSRRPENSDGDARPATLTSALGEPPQVADLIDALLAGFRSSFGGNWRTDPAGGSFPGDLLTECRRRYTSQEWTWRR